MNDIIKELQDMRYLNWTRTRKSSGTAGSFLKSYDDSSKKKKYYKLSDYDPVNKLIGHECVNEIIVQRFLDLLGINHLKYTLINALIAVDGMEINTYLCESEDFKKPGESKIALEDYFMIHKEGNESPFEFCLRNGWEKYIYDMLLTDYIILNQDRHGANIEVLRDAKNRLIRLAPLFDHGLSLLCRCHTPDEIKKFDVCEDRKVQTFIGTSSTFENIHLLPKEYINSLPNISESDIDDLFTGLDDVISKEHLDKINEMILKRWYSLGNI